MTYRHQTGSGSRNHTAFVQYFKFNGKEYVAIYTPELDWDHFAMLVSRQFFEDATDESIPKFIGKASQMTSMVGKSFYSQMLPKMQQRCSSYRSYENAPQLDIRFVTTDRNGKPLSEKNTPQMAFNISRNIIKFPIMSNIFDNCFCILTADSIPFLGSIMFYGTQDMTESRLTMYERRFQNHFNKYALKKYGSSNVNVDMVDAIQSGLYVYTL